VRVPPQPSWILIVDDDQAIRDALSEMLLDEGYPVATAANGMEAIAWLRTQQPRTCMVLLDLMMPVMDGVEFLRAKKDDPALRAIPVIVVTAAGRGFALDRTPDVKNTILKPIDLPELMAALESGCA
jgi:CheY-like chemotaxis protein